MIQIDNEFADRLIFKRKQLSLTQSNIAEAIGITQRQVAAYEAGTARPREKTLFNLAYYLGVSPSWLANGSDTNIQEWDDFTPTTSLVQVPIYDLMTLTDQQVSGDKSLIQTHNELHPLAVELNHVSKHSFAIKIYGDSMEMQGKLGIPNGSIVTFDPDAKIKSGDICLIKTFDEIFMIKQLFIDAKQATIHSLNISYADMILKNDEYKIIAKAVHVAITL